ncbi:tetratricopeptide repeat protein [Actinoplanes sp. NPDC051513]|uniref:fibronectin type III domain-containing protein n=1 Tax=Actinoplanes sp. NPDC051513 TaxID=3363908 RepID=UPI00378A182C
MAATKGPAWRQLRVPGSMARVSQPSPLAPARQQAHALAESGDLAGAVALLERAVALGKVNLAEDDPDVLVTALQLGRVLQQDDDPVAARRVLEDAYGAGSWRLGDSDALMLEISHEIAMVAEELGNKHEARKAFSRVAELGPATLGEGHPAIARARAYLGQEQDLPVRTEDASPPQPVTPPQVSAPPAQQVSAPPTYPTSIPPAPPPRAPTYQSSASPAYRPSDRAVDEEPTTAIPMQQPPQPAYPQPEPPIWQEQPQPPIWHEQPPPWAPPPQQPFAPPPYEQKPKRGLGIFAAIAAVLAAVIAVSALVFVLANRSGDKNDSDVPTLGGKPPTNVALQDAGTRIKVTWKDPANGSVSFLVAMAQPGQQLKPVGTLGPGQTSYEMNALNPSLNYCFAVVAVYRNNKFATSQQACTDRPTATK